MLDNDDIGKNYQMEFFFPAAFREDLKPFTYIEDKNFINTFKKDLSMAVTC